MDRFETLVAAWLAGQRSMNTRAAYERDLACFRDWFGGRRGGPLGASTADIEAFRRACEQAGASAATVGRRLAAVSSFFRFARPAPHGNPVAGASRPERSDKSVTVQLTPEQVAAVWNAARRQGPKISTLVGLVLFDGLKSNEALSLDLGHIAFGRRGTVAAVSRRGRTETVVLDPRTARAVHQYLLGRRAGPLLLGDNPTRPSARLTRFGVDYLVKRAGQAAGLERPLTVNTLRCTYIVTAHTGGIDVADVRDAVGHASARTTRRYL